MRKRMYLFMTMLAAGSLVIGLGGCSGSTDPAPAPVTSAIIPSTETVPVPATSEAPPPVVTPSPELPPPPPSPAPLPPEPTVNQVTLYYVAIGDDSAVGERVDSECGDKLIATTVMVDPVPVSQTLKAAFDALLSNHDAQIGQSGLYNTVGQSDLTFVSGSREGGIVTVHLTGTVVSGGVCDGPRIMAQLVRTATESGKAGNAEIFVNDVPLASVLSGRG